MSETSQGRARSGLSTVLLIATATLGVQMMTVVTGIISARVLGVEGRGQLALAVAASALFARLTMAGALPVSVSALLAREHLTARDGLRPFVRRWSLQALLPSLGAGIYVAVVLRHADPVLCIGLALAAALLTYQAIASGLIGGALQGELASIRTVAIGAILLALPFPVALVALLLVTDIGDPVLIAAVLVGSGVVGWLLNVRLLRPSEGRESTLDPHEMRRMTRVNYVAAVGTINSLGLDRNLVGAWLGAVALGLYAVGAAFANLSSIVGNGVASLLLPRLTAAEPEQQRRLVRSWMITTAVLMTLMVAGVEAVIAPVIRGAFGDEFEGAIEIARWLVLADGLLGFRRLPICVLQARGRAGVASAIELGVTAVIVVAIGLAAAAGDVVLIAVAMVAGGVLSLVLLGIAMAVCRPIAAPKHRAVGR